MELLWTGFLAFRRREMKPFGRSSLWMFPIYGMAAFIGPLYRRIKDKGLVLRGTIYALCIFGRIFNRQLLKEKKPLSLELLRLQI